RLEQQLSSDPDLSYVATFTGEGAPRFFLPLDQQLRNPNFAQLLLMPHSIEARERLLVKVRAILAADFPNVRFKADRLFMGPPVGWAVQVRVIGPDRDEVRRLAGEVHETMRATPDVTNVHTHWPGPEREAGNRSGSRPRSRRDFPGCAPLASGDVLGIPDRRVPRRRRDRQSDAPRAVRHA